MRNKRIAVINDLAGFGRCSLSVMLPVLSAMGHQCCAVPTAILSSTDGIDGFYCHDLTAHLPSYLRQWREMGLSFDAIYTGYLSSVGQLELVLSFLRDFRREDTLLLVDPVLGDQGKVGSNCTAALIRQYRRLIAQADLITPNLTEAAFLCGMEYQEFPSGETLEQMEESLLSLGAKTAVITGVKDGESIHNLICSNQGRECVSTLLCPQERIGTGDLFSSILLGALLSGEPLQRAVERAAGFTGKALRFSEREQVPAEEGICFEPLLGLLTPAGKDRQEAEG